ncbi:MAG TPA: GNAT family N-acetyltransferase [Dehalococcoidia bacterium]|nr:GNAT family N-acetyltransferase [Dehalococcoidia bacterium]
MLVIELATNDDLSVLRNLHQLYLYDLTEFTHDDPDPEGRFPHEPLEGYVEGAPDRAALIARLWGRPAAFALVAAGSVLDAGACGVRTVRDLFVLRRYRRRGIGTRLALEAFRRFPGRWEVRQDASNKPAHTFWRKVIDRYTAGRFVELTLDDHRWRGPVQTFDNSLLLG